MTPRLVSVALPVARSRCGCPSRRRKGNRNALGLVVLGVALLVGACGVQADEGPRALAADEVPYGLLEQAPPTTDAPRPPTVPTEPVSVYFVSGERMYKVVRQVNAPPSVPKALTALLFGPLEDEADSGVRSAINPTATIQARSIDAATYLVDLSSEFAQGSVSEQILALAQVVWTATERPGVTGVRFTLNGAAIQVPTPNGSSGDPVGREAFAELAPLPPGIDPPA